MLADEIVNFKCTRFAQHPYQSALRVAAHDRIVDDHEALTADLVFALAGTMSMGNSVRQRVEAWHTVAVAMGFAAIAALWILMWIIGSGDEDDEFVDLTGPGMLTLTLACVLSATVRVAVINFGADSQRKR